MPKNTITRTFSYEGDLPNAKRLRTIAKGLINVPGARVEVYTAGEAYELAISGYRTLARGADRPRAGTLRLVSFGKRAQDAIDLVREKLGAEPFKEGETPGSPMDDGVAAVKADSADPWDDDLPAGIDRVNALYTVSSGDISQNLQWVDNRGGLVWKGRMWLMVPEHAADVMMRVKVAPNEWLRFHHVLRELWPEMRAAVEKAIAEKAPAEDVARPAGEEPDIAAAPKPKAEVETSQAKDDTSNKADDWFSRLSDLKIQDPFVREASDWAARNGGTVFVRNVSGPLKAGGADLSKYAVAGLAIAREHGDDKGARREANDHLLKLSAILQRGNEAARAHELVELVGQMAKRADLRVIRMLLELTAASLYFRSADGKKKNKAARLRGKAHEARSRAQRLADGIETSSVDTVILVTPQLAEAVNRETATKGKAEAKVEPKAEPKVEPEPQPQPAAVTKATAAQPPSGMDKLATTSMGPAMHDAVLEIMRGEWDKQEDAFLTWREMDRGILNWARKSDHQLTRDLLTFAGKWINPFPPEDTGFEDPAKRAWLPLAFAMAMEGKTSRLDITEDPTAAAVAALEYFDVGTVMQSFAVVTLGGMKGAKAKMQYRKLVSALADWSGWWRGEAIAEVANTLIEDRQVINGIALETIAMALNVVAAEALLAFARDEQDSESLRRQAMSRAQGLLMTVGDIADADNAGRIPSSQLAIAASDYADELLDGMARAPDGSAEPIAETTAVSLPPALPAKGARPESVVIEATAQKDMGIAEWRAFKDQLIPREYARLELKIDRGVTGEIRELDTNLDLGGHWPAIQETDVIGLTLVDPTYGAIRFAEALLAECAELKHEELDALPDLNSIGRSSAELDTEYWQFRFSSDEGKFGEMIIDLREELSRLGCGPDMWVSLFDGRRLHIITGGTEGLIESDGISWFAEYDGEESSATAVSFKGMDDHDRKEITELLQVYGERLPDPQVAGGGGSVQSIYVADPFATSIPMAGMAPAMSGGVMMGMSAVPRILV